MTPLAVAVFKQNEEIVNLLLQRGASVDGRPSADVPTPLHLAAWKGNLKMVKRLVEDYHADPNLKVKWK